MQKNRAKCQATSNVMFCITYRARSDKESTPVNNEMIII